MCLIDALNDDFFVIFRGKSTKNSRHRQNKSQQPYAQELQATSFGRLLFAVHSFRSSIGGKWTRFSRNNNNTKMHRSNIICPFSDAWTAARCYFWQCRFGFGITFADGKPRIKTVSQTVPVWFWNYTYPRKKNGNNIDVDTPSLDCVIPSERSDEGSLKQC